jgi:hypothetical protein
MNNSNIWTFYRISQKQEPKSFGFDTQRQGLAFHCVVRKLFTVINIDIIIY